ncbi:hypothetical protein Pla52o_39880 [Novipirellula galeiformis]|uniref:UspA domain-containing protein n=1 Tax=Novipirellula galeiformis TaxID=2528004 RepID=A0A5C6CC23_9BACT|nr:universal stress protein [Novipirellula galeiformis]TWU20956.1 hypothetical protein Pla52o_39880 [Novipirellula galeiformis]
MKRFKSILVGVALAEGDRLVSERVPSASEEAVARGTWLAKANDAQLNFLHVLPSWAANLDANTQVLIQNDHGQQTVRDHAKEVMAKLVHQAESEGIAAESRVVFGKSWVEAIRQVLRKHHDLVIVGAKDTSQPRPFLAGSTAIKLLRKCPCAVWVTRPTPDRILHSILVAHDLRSVGNDAMELGCSLAKIHHAKLHVLHAAEYANYDNIFPTLVSLDSAEQYRQNAEKQIAEQLAKFHLAHEAQVHFSTRAPDLAIWHCIEEENVELLVMGTIARTGISGLITGNTAERLLPLLSCSILAIKPRDFQSPVTLEPHG